MVTPPRKRAGYALLTAGLLLFFDTETFLRTNWSPLHVPLSVPAELMLSYVLLLCGTVAFLAPILVRMVSNYAPGGSVRTGERFEYESVELRLRGRLPLQPRRSALSDRGVVGGTIVLLLLVPAFLMIEWQHPTPKGIYVQLSAAHYWDSNQDNAEGPIIVSVKRQDDSAQIFLNGKEIRREELEQALKAELARRANWVVFVEGDNSLPYAEPMHVLDVGHALHAKVVILTPKLKEEIGADRRNH
jgi:biopolymer transport protein ExbD